MGGIRRRNGVIFDAPINGRNGGKHFWGKREVTREKIESTNQSFSLLNVVKRRGYCGGWRVVLHHLTKHGGKDEGGFFFNG